MIVLTKPREKRFEEVMKKLNELFKLLRQRNDLEVDKRIKILQSELIKLGGDEAKKLITAMENRS